tara:strand:+ start:178 stop:420 length:243 start_codon:yes stop_codon:yes gene_type:complete
VYVLNLKEIHKMAMLNTLSGQVTLTLYFGAIFLVEKTKLVKSKEPLKEFKVYAAALYPALFTTIRTLLKTLWSAKFKGTR